MVVQPTRLEQIGASLRADRLSLGLSLMDIAEAIRMGSHRRCSLHDVLQVEAGTHAAPHGLIAAYRAVIEDAKP